MNKAVFLDRDGTINVDKDYLYKIEDFEFLPGAVEGLKLLQEKGYLLIIITNQSGIARGYYTEEDFQKLNSWMLEQLKLQGVEIAAVYHCPHGPNDGCTCRKPALGLFEQAIKDFDLDIDQCIAIGDKERDLSICESTGCRSFLVDYNRGYSILEIISVL